MGRALANRVLNQLESSPPIATRPDLIDLTIPEVAETPSHVRAAAKSALDEGETHYTAGTGIQPLREAIAHWLTEMGYPVEAGNIGVTNGGTEAIYIALQCALKPGERALIVEPMSQHIVDMVRFIGATPELLPTSATDDFVPDHQAIRQSDANVLLIASPSPISGKRIPPDRLSEIIQAARDTDKAVILDLSYASGLYETGTAQLSSPELVNEIVLVGSFSTAHGLSGWRIGFFSAPAANLPLFQGLKMSMSICTTAVSQFAAAAALEEPFDWFVDRRGSHSDNRDTALRILGEAGFTAIEPDAFPALLIDVGDFGGGETFAQRLADEAGVIVDPGNRFGDSTAGYIRINLGVTEETLRAGLERIVSIAADGE